MIDQCLICGGPLVYTPAPQRQDEPSLSCDKLPGHYFSWEFMRAPDDVSFFFMFTMDFRISMSREYYWYDNLFKHNEFVSHIKETWKDVPIDSIEKLLLIIDDIKQENSVYFDSLLFL